MSRAFFEWVTLGAFGTMVLLGVAFWAIGARNVRRGLLAPAAAGDAEALITFGRLGAISDL